MSLHTSPLDDVKIAAPCRASWERMTGNDRVRFCDSCNLNVYNLSGMSKNEAETLVGNSEGRLCVRFYRRADGTILTKNCPVGLRAVRRRVSRIAGSIVSAVLGFFAGIGFDSALAPRRDATTGTIVIKEHVPPLEPMMGDIALPAREVPTEVAPEMGAMAVDYADSPGEAIAHYPAARRSRSRNAKSRAFKR
jgi:hypothetical protein